MEYITKCDGENTPSKQWQNLTGWNGITLENLLLNLNNHLNDEVRIYTVASTMLDKDLNIRQKGSAPNMEGGIITLGTCKHSMRQKLKCDEWIGKWILGVTSRDKNKGFKGQHYLLYMMKIHKAFYSHKELYDYLAIENNAALKIKNAVKNPLGDIFKPRNNCADPLNPKMYETPHKSHSHGYEDNDQWCSDIVYDKGKCAPLLLADKNNSFVWPKPMIIFKQNRGVGNKKLSIGESLFRELEMLE